MSWFKKVLKIAVNPIGAANAAAAKEISKAAGANKKVQEAIGVATNPTSIVTDPVVNTGVNAAEAGIELTKKQVDAFKAQIDMVRAILRGDMEMLKEAGSDWIDAQVGMVASYASLAASLKPRLADLIPPLRELYMDDPAVEVVNLGLFTTDLVYYMNGINTNHDAAVHTAQLLNAKLQRPIGLLYNDTIGMLGDLTESCYDRAWPNLSATDLVAQANPATRRLTSLLYHAKSRISIITHSQGCLIMRNAFITADGFAKGETAPKVAWLGAAMPLRDEEVIPKPSKFTALIDPNDPVATFVGLRTDTEVFEQAIARHSMDDVYLPLISSTQLW